MLSVSSFEPTSLVTSMTWLSSSPENDFISVEEKLRLFSRQMYMSPPKAVRIMMVHPIPTTTFQVELFLSLLLFMEELADCSRIPNVKDPCSFSFLSSQGLPPLLSCPPSWSPLLMVLIVDDESGRRVDSIVCHVSLKFKDFKGRSATWIAIKTTGYSVAVSLFTISFRSSWTCIKYVWSSSVFSRASIWSSLSATCTSSSMGPTTSPS
mmetsp:Transcript_4887/g.10791  ORF Transcript_4887/g.10791 Transcript_4887/m.10791 type:complete len:209 (+) Transcript_4887:3316-3942(+)